MAPRCVPVPVRVYARDMDHETTQGRTGVGLVRPPQRQVYALQVRGPGRGARTGG